MKLVVLRWCCVTRSCIIFWWLPLFITKSRQYHQDFWFNWSLITSAIQCSGIQKVIFRFPINISLGTWEKFQALELCRPWDLEKNLSSYIMYTLLEFGKILSSSILAFLGVRKILTVDLETPWYLILIRTWKIFNLWRYVTGIFFLS